MDTIRSLALCNKANASEFFRQLGGSRLNGLRLVAVVFLAVAAGCGDGQAPDHADAMGDPSPGALPGNEDRGPVVILPRHDAPLETDRGGEYFAAQLTLREGCLRAEVSPSHDANDPGSWLLIWPDGFTFETEAETVRVVDELGRDVAVVGDHVRFNRAALTFEQAAERELVTGLSNDCADSYFLVGDEVSAFDSRI